MKKFGLIISAIVLASFSWIAFVREPLAPIPTICAELSEETNLDFSINTMDYTGVELSLNNKMEGKGMYVHFQMANTWKTGRTGLVVKNINASSSLKGGMNPDKYLADDKRKEQGEKDFSNFMKDKKGKPVSSYTFKHTLVEGQDGKTYMRMAYDGPAMEMLQTLEVPHVIPIPAHVSKQFVPKGVIQFQPGTFTFDAKINGFYIPVQIR
jgi:hypothetical protein